MKRAFEGVRILAVEHMLAMPYATQLLAFMGARVVKVEPPGGESGRKSRPKLNGDDDEQHGAVFFRANLGKRSVAINLKTDEGRDVFLRMVPHFDILAENMRPGVLVSMNLTFDVLRQAKPDIILATLSGFGHLNGSPYFSWPAYAPIIEASGGLYTIGRDPDDPLATGSLAALADVTGGIFAALAMSSALRRRDLTGEAQHVDVSMLDAAMVLNDAGPLLHSMGVSPELLTGRRVGLLESFEASDGRFAVTIMREHMFHRFAKVIGHPEWVDDERFARREQWVGLVPSVIRPAVNEWVADRTKLECARELAEAGVAAGPINDASDIVADEHVRRHHMLLDVPDAGYEQPLKVFGNPIKFADGEPAIDTTLPSLGGHTSEVLGELGFSPEEVRDLADRKIVVA
jgi:crotonobetainyl-CoA:carnitine CoA-transferase CaiB-like acyl-CoA transferase